MLSPASPELSLRRIRVYSRRGCHLCEVLIEDLLPLIRSHLELEVQDIDTRPAWVENYGERIPVVEYEDRAVCEYTLDRDAIRSIIAALPGS
jgi:hypothetical protein